MGRLQRFVLRFVGDDTAAAMEAESRSWVLVGACGHETSVWDLGGIRYKAAGRPWTMGRCSSCGERVSGRLRRRAEP